MEEKNIYRPLLEAQDDFPKIDAMICAMFGIPVDAKVLTRSINVNVRAEDPDTAAAIRDEMYERAVEFTEDADPCNIQSFPEDEITPNSPPAVAKVGELLRVFAMMALTFGGDDGLGVGDSSMAVRRLNEGKPSEIEGSELAKSFKVMTEDGIAAAMRNRGLADYVALVSRMYLPGLIRIAFSELNLMTYLCDTRPEVARLMEELNSVTNGRVPSPGELPPCNVARLEYFTKTVIPALALKAVITQGDQTGICDGGTLKQTERYFGTDTAETLRDYARPLTVPVDSELRTSDGKGLDYRGMLAVLDMRDADVDDLKNRSMYSPTGEPFKYVRHAEGEEEGPEEGTDDPYVVRLHSDEGEDEDNPECPSYKINDWYVVYVQDYRHSSRGWFRFNEPSAKDTGYRFWLDGRTSKNSPENDHRAVGDRWCIVFNGQDYWNSYGGGGKHTAYYLVHEGALDSDVLDASRVSDKYRGTSVGCILAGYDDEYSSMVKGLVKSNAGMMDRGNNYASDIPGPFTGRLPDRLLREVNSMLHGTDLPYALNLIMLYTIGVWDSSIVGREKIKATVKELSAKYFPVHDPGTEIEDASSRKLAKCRGISDAAEILTAAVNRPADEFPEKTDILSGKTVFEIGGGNYVAEQVDCGGNVGVLLKPVDGDNGGYLFAMNNGNELVPVNRSPKSTAEIALLIGNCPRDRMDGHSRLKPIPEVYTSGFRLAPGFRGKAAGMRVGTDGTGAVYISGPDTDGSPVKVGKTGGIPTADRYTYCMTEKGPNILAMNSGDAPGNEGFVGFCRDGKIRWYGLVVTQGSGASILRDNEGYYSIGRIDGDARRFKDNRYQAYVSVDSDGYIVENMGLNDDFLGNLSENARGRIGLGIPNGRFDGDSAGTITWYSSDSLEEVGQEPIKVSMLDMHRQDGRPREH